MPANTERYSASEPASRRPSRHHTASQARLITVILVTMAGIAIWPPILAGQSEDASAWQQLSRDILHELIEINTTHSTGSTTKAAEAVAARLRTEGFPEEDIHILGPHPAKGNLVVRYRGRGERPPLLLLAHLDVVEALPEDWSLDPFTFREEDRYFYGRGTTDDKDMAAAWVANLIRWKREAYQPSRDLIVALTADEEGGQYNGVAWLLANYRELVDAEYAFNEGGSGLLKKGEPLLNELQASEKVYLSFRLEVTDPGGHSSRPRKNNAIYRLAAALSRLATYDFPVTLNEITRTFFLRMAQIETGQTATDMYGVTQRPPDPEAVERLATSPYFNAIMRTTCVATLLEAGHAENALPQTARATVNCRILPDHSPEAVERTLVRVLADTAIGISRIGIPTPSPPSPLAPEIMEAAERVTDEIWPRTPVVPVMLTGATDGLYLRNAGIPTYGISGMFHDIDDVRAHGRDERIAVGAFYDEVQFLYRLVKELAGG